MYFDYSLTTCTHLEACSAQCHTCIYIYPKIHYSILFTQVNVDKAQQKQKECYDSKHMVGNCYNVGSLVLKKDFLRKKRCGGKLDNKWLGPYMIITSLGKGLFKLRELNGEKVSKVMFSTICCQDDTTCTLIYFLYVVYC